MWYVLVWLAINILYICFMPKKISKQEMYATWGVLAAIGFNADLTMGLLVDLYDFGKDGVQWYDLIVDTFFAPSFGIIYLNYLPKQKNKLIVYILFWTALSVFIEWGAVLAGFEKLKRWTPWYSIPIYASIFIFLRWNIKFLRQARAADPLSNS